MMKNSIYLVLIVPVINLSSCGEGGEYNDLEGVAGDASVVACDRPYYQQMLGTYSGIYLVSNWLGPTKEVLENTCLWNVRLEFYKEGMSQYSGAENPGVLASVEKSLCPIKVKYEAKFVSQENYSSDVTYKCLEMKSTFSFSDDRFTDREFWDDPQWPMEFSLNDGTQPIPSSQSNGLKYVTPLTGNDKIIINKVLKQVDGNIIFRPGMSNISMEGVLNKQ